MSKRILMIEDQRGLVLSLGDRLRSEGYTFESASSGDEGLEKGLKGGFDLILVDLMLPGKNGFEVIRSLRSEGLQIPLLMVTARDQLIDKVSGLRLGADDYIVKPFAMDELLARIETNLRREIQATEKNTSEAASGWTDPTLPDFSFGPFCINYKLAGLFQEGRRIPLTFQEFRLLCVFVHFRGTVLDADTLLSKAWGYETNVTSRTLYVHMSWLRKKIQSPQRPGGYITTVRRFGYLFEA